MIDPTYDWNRTEFFPITLLEATADELARWEVKWVMGGEAKAGSRSKNPND